MLGPGFLGPCSQFPAHLLVLVIMATAFHCRSFQFIRSHQSSDRHIEVLHGIGPMQVLLHFTVEGHVQQQAVTAKKLEHVGTRCMLTLPTSSREVHRSRGEQGGQSIGLSKLCPQAFGPIRTTIGPKAKVLHLGLHANVSIQHIIPQELPSGLGLGLWSMRPKNTSHVGPPALHFSRWLSCIDSAVLEGKLHCSVPRCSREAGLLPKCQCGIDQKAFCSRIH